MLIGALAIFTLVAAMGLLMVCGIYRGSAVDPLYAALHGIASLVGSVFVIVAALEGDERLYLNIAMALVIIGLGVTMGIMSKKGKKVPKALLATHVGLAVSCYGVLGFFALNPHANLF